MDKREQVERALRLCLTLLARVSLAVAVTCCVATAQDIKAIEGELQATETALQAKEADLAAIEADRPALAELTKAVKNGEIVFVATGGPLFPVSVDVWTASIFLHFATGKVTHDELTRMIKELSGLRRMAVEAIDLMNRDVEANVRELQSTITKLRDKRSYLLNERARLRESAPVKNPGEPVRIDGKTAEELQKIFENAVKQPEVRPQPKPTPEKPKTTNPTTSTASKNGAWIGTWVCQTCNGPVSIIINSDGTGTWKDTRPGQPGTWEGRWTASDETLSLIPNNGMKYSGLSLTIKSGKARDPWGNVYVR